MTNFINTVTLIGGFFRFESSSSPRRWTQIQSQHPSIRCWK